MEVPFNTDHYFGQFLVKLVVFLSDDELIFLLLCETYGSPGGPDSVFVFISHFSVFAF